MSHSSGRALRLFKFLSAVILALTLGAASFSAFHAGRRVFPRASPTIPSALIQQVNLINSATPANAPIFYIGQMPEYWNSRMYQRVLYPRLVFLVFTQAEIQGAGFKALKEKYGVRYAISSGAPPIDAGFKWQTALPALPDNPDSFIFGELKP